MKQKQMFPLIHNYVLKFINNYVKKDELLPENISNYIVPPALGDNTGLVGGLALALDVLKISLKID